jgi:ankyrin repeat protein
VNATDTGGWTPLICACTGGHCKIAALLVAAGAEVRVADRLGRTPLSIASENAMSETTAMLVRAGGK